ncbi:SUN domain-containing protein 2-like isoform X2 [Seriola aureovittata]|nr:SUN domain-containing protein 2-like isoform X2 [Seriola aureovittata]
MSRKSIRLETSRYYNNNGESSVTYRETVYRIFLSRKALGCSQPEGRETPVNGNGNRRFVFLILPLCLGLAFLTLMLSSNFVDAGLSKSPVSPLLKTLDPAAQCEEMERQVRELQNELLGLKTQMNYLHPVADTLANFALESLGAKVFPHLSSKSFQTKETSMMFFGIPLRQQPVPPQTVLQGHSPLLPGRCWAFAGGRGHLFIALSHRVTISHVTLGHISKNLSPTGTVTTAPREFSVYAMENLGDEETNLGTFLYDQDGDPVQTFKIPDNKRGVFNHVKLHVESNWGHPDHSCLYSFKVHGKLAVD